MKIAGIILAAGESRRMGRPKQLLAFQGKPLLQHVLDHARASRLDEVILVLGSRSELIAPAIERQGTRMIVNPHFAQGQSTSLVAAIEALADDVDGALFLLGDQPGVTTDIIDAVLDGFDGDPRSIVMTDWQGQSGHPVLLGRGYFDQIRSSLTGDIGARPIIAENRDRIRLVPVAHPTPPDVDTEDDYARLLHSAGETDEVPGPGIRR